MIGVDEGVFSIDCGEWCYLEVRKLVRMHVR
jgi:hypothetical protein